MQDATETLRHEVLAHYGLNLFSPVDKSRILDSIVQAGKSNPFIRKLWKKAEKDYPEHKDNPPYIAEELFARLAEKPPAWAQTWIDNHLIIPVVKILRKMGFLKGEITQAELRRLLASIAEGIRRGAPQRTFPQSNRAQFSRSQLDENAAPTIERNLKDITVTDIKKLGPAYAKNLRSLGLPLLGRRQIVDLYGDDVPEIRAYDRISRHKTQEWIETLKISASWHSAFYLALATTRWLPYGSGFRHPCRIAGFTATMGIAGCLGGNRGCLMAGVARRAI